MHPTTCRAGDAADFFVISNTLFRDESNPKNLVVGGMSCLVGQRSRYGLP